MSGAEVRIFLVETLGASRFVVREEDKAVEMETRELSRVSHASVEEWNEFRNELRRTGWKIQSREHIPVVVGG
ncbi:MAG: hypothetical protein KGJ01_02355 [Patescibacteria group bacterium]|nr:hypothetical protein [Patescibacteria group bacterium]